MKHLLGIFPTLHGVELLADRKLDPRLVKDTFPGGVNLTRRAQNLRAIDQSVKLHYLHDPLIIMGSRFAICAVKAAMGVEFTVAVGCHPAALAWYETLHRRLAE
jgi:hypothetical protein